MHARGTVRSDLQHAQGSASLRLCMYIIRYMWRGDDLVRHTHTGTGKALTSYRDSNKRLGNRLLDLKLTRAIKSNE